MLLLMRGREVMSKIKCRVKEKIHQEDTFLLRMANLWTSTEDIQLEFSYPDDDINVGDIVFLQLVKE